MCPIVSTINTHRTIAQCATLHVVNDQFWFRFLFINCNFTFTSRLPSLTLRIRYRLIIGPLLHKAQLHFKQIINIGIPATDKKYVQEAYSS